MCVISKSIPLKLEFAELFEMVKLFCDETFSTHNGYIKFCLNIYFIPVSYGVYLYSISKKK